MSRWAFVLMISIGTCVAARTKKTEKPLTSPLDVYIEEAMGRSQSQQAASPGSAWTATARFSNLAGDLRANQVDDIVTILVAERASAVAKGTSKTARSSGAKASVDALGGVTRATGPFPNLAKLSSETKMDGEGSTTRETTLSTTLTARVTHVLPNGNLVVAGTKNVAVNSENQLITVRGVVRPVDLTTGNVVRSDRMAQMEIRVNGKGMVADAVKRPFILYRLLLGLLPF